MVTLAIMSSRTCRTLMLLVFVTTTLGCTTLRPVIGSDLEAVSNQISAGDKIEVTRQDHRLVIFRVSEITKTGIGGEGNFIDYGDILQIRVVKKSPGRTVIGVVAAALLLAVLIAGPANYPAPP